MGCGASVPEGSYAVGELPVGPDLGSPLSPQEGDVQKLRAALKREESDKRKGESSLRNALQAGANLPMANTHPPIPCSNEYLQSVVLYTIVCIRLSYYVIPTGFKHRNMSPEL